MFGLEMLTHRLKYTHPKSIHCITRASNVRPELGLDTSFCKQEKGAGGAFVESTFDNRQHDVFHSSSIDVSGVGKAKRKSQVNRVKLVHFWLFTVTLTYTKHKICSNVYKSVLCSVSRTHRPDQHTHSLDKQIYAWSQAMNNVRTPFVWLSVFVSVCVRVKLCNPRPFGWSNEKDFVRIRYYCHTCTRTKWDTHTHTQHRQTSSNKYANKLNNISREKSWELFRLVSHR